MDERGNLFSLPVNYELSRGESNPRLPELSVINEYHILCTAQYDSDTAQYDSRCPVASTKLWYAAHMR